MTERESVIGLAKGFNITPDELGCITTFCGFDEATLKTLFDQLKNFIDDSERQEDARKFVAEKFWKLLGIEPRKYKVVEVKLAKTVYKTIHVAVPNDNPNSDAEDLIEDSMQNIEDYDEDESWEVDSTDYTVDTDLTADEVKSQFEQEELYNWDDFEEVE